MSERQAKPSSNPTEPMGQGSIEALQQPFLQALQQSSVVFEAPTGTGKSTRLPVWCSQLGRVLIVEPRRLACRSLARYLAEESARSGGVGVGYAVRFDSRFDESSGLVFATPGIALRWYAGTGLKSFDVVVLDEFHERRWDTDLLAAMLVHDCRRLVLTSATVEGERLAEYLGGQRLRGEAASHPVEVRYTGRDELPSLKGLDKRVASAVNQACRETSGDILTFLPGRGEIESARRELQRSGPPAEIVTLHASVPAAEQDRALQAGSSKRIILATNVAETSLTIPGVTAVVDSGLERRTQHRNGRTVLGLSSVSRAAADQRQGRAGRLGPGLCIRLWGAAAKLEPATPPEVRREELTDLYLAAAACDRPADDLRFPDSLPEHAASRARQRLQAMGAIDGSGRILEHGRRLFPLPLEPLLAHLLLVMPDESSRQFMLDLVAALSADSLLFRGAHGEREQEALKQWAPETCDATTLVRLVRQDPPKEITVKASGLQQARRIAAQLRKLLDLPNVSGTEDLSREAAVQSAVKNAPELAFVRRRSDSKSMGNGVSEVEVAQASRIPPSAQAAAVFDLHSLPGRGTTRTISYATCLAPMSFAELAEAGLGQVDVHRPAVDPDGTIRARAVRSYAGRRIEERDMVPRGEDLRLVLAELILQGGMFPGLGSRIRKDIQAWNLALKLGWRSGNQVEPQQWLTGRLAELGLEAQEDVQLLDETDLVFEGLPEGERERFDRSYPRRLHLGDLELDVDYDPVRKTITLIKRRGQRRNPPSRMELPTWGREWSLRYKEGNRVVPL